MKNAQISGGYRINMFKLFVIIGKSATGKDSIFKRLKEQKEITLKTVVPYTTRPIREGETQGVEYFFVEEQRLEDLTAEQRVIEKRSYHTVHGIWNYFTVDDEQIDLEKAPYIMINTLEGFRQISDYFGKEAVIPIYIEVEDGLRLSRALERERREKKPKYAELCRRFLADTEDFKEENLRALGISKCYQNIEMEACIQAILHDIKEAVL